MVQSERIELGKVLTFRAPDARPPRPESSNGERGAILFFTGVRYDRPVPAAVPSQPDRASEPLAG